MDIEIPDNHYVKGITINDSNIDIDLQKKKKVALLFISVNDRYWPYLGQVLKDCRTHFLPHHNVDYFVWSDYSDEGKKNQLDSLEDLFNDWKKAEDKQQPLNILLQAFAQTVRLYEIFYPQKVKDVVAELAKSGMQFKYDGAKYWVESTRQMTDEDVEIFYQTTKHILLYSHSDLDETLKGVEMTETAPVEWPAPTLMRYHLFLQQEEKLKEYDYIFYLDADMRVVEKISDEILGEGLTAAPHPGYELATKFIPPYEPNPESTAYIHRLGRIVEEQGQKRFRPFYAAGGFQGGRADDFLEAMLTMKKNIDKDFDNGYTAIWNDESHWNKYLWDLYKGSITFLDPSYVYPDSLIKEYYEKIWGRSYQPKMITLTKPFTLSSQGAEELKKLLQ